MYAWLYPVYELACAYSTQTFVFRDLLIQLFLPPDPRLIHDWEVDFTRAPVAFESVWLKITIINRKKKSEGGGEDVISNTRQVDKSADEGVGEGGASQCWWNPRARLRLSWSPIPPTRFNFPLLPLIQVQCGAKCRFFRNNRTKTDSTGNSDCFVEWCESKVTLEEGQKPPRKEF